MSRAWVGMFKQVHPTRRRHTRSVPSHLWRVRSNNTKGCTTSTSHLGILDHHYLPQENPLLLPPFPPQPVNLAPKMADGNNWPPLDDLTTIVAWVNIKFPTFKGLSIEDANNHVWRFLCLCRVWSQSGGCLPISFHSSLESLGGKWFNQFTLDHFLTWEAMQTSLCATFCPSKYRERIPD